MYGDSVQYCIFPPKKFTAKIPNIIHTTNTTISTLMIPETDPISATTIVFMPELCEINLKGLSVLKSLKILIIGRFTLSKDASIKEVITMKKSS